MRYWPCVRFSHSRTVNQVRSQEVSNNVSPWLGRWRCAPPIFCWMSRLPVLISSRRRYCSKRLPALRQHATSLSF